MLANNIVYSMRCVAVLFKRLYFTIKRTIFNICSHAGTDLKYKSRGQNLKSGMVDTVFALLAQCSKHTMYNLARGPGHALQENFKVYPPEIECERSFD